MQRFYYVYILKCADGSYYTGITNDMDRRLSEHEEGLDSRSYTHARRPVSLVYHESFTAPRFAIEREKQIKRWSKAKKEALINEHLEDLKSLSRCRKDQ